MSVATEARMRRVRSAAVELAVWESGPDDAPTVILVHGYPDTHLVWSGVAQRLAEHFHVVTYDVRGAGQSKAQPGLRYDLDLLAADLRAVAAACGGGRPVHVVGHDWGAIQSWEAVTETAAPGFIASFTSISGPCLDHVGQWLRAKVASADVLSQAVHSIYVGLFGVPGLGPLAARTLIPVLFSQLKKQGISDDSAPSPELVADAVHGVPLYRQNIFKRLKAPRMRRAHVPVQLVVVRDDTYVMPPLADTALGWVDELYRREVRGPHWIVRTEPDKIARFIREFVAQVEARADAPRLRRFRAATAVGPRASSGQPFAGQLVVITGAGSGIGRATAYAFAERGAKVVAADINPESAAETARRCQKLGVAATSAQVDVSDTAQMEKFAHDVLATQGVPDVVVNNAGVAAAGYFLDTPVSEWERMLGVNLLGVMHGSRLFGAAMVARAQGGHIVNLASAAAYTPTVTLPAYATSKAAVLMLSECLRAELAAAGIGVSAICPGLIDTPITTASRYVGVSAEEQERRRQRAAQLYRRRGFGPERVATAIVRAVLNNEALVPVAAEAHVLLLMSRLAPGLARRLARLELG